MASTKLRIARLPHAEGLALPAYETSGAAGMDVRAALPEDAPVSLAPGARTLIPTGLKMVVPDGFELQVRSRSGLALKHGVICLNSPGTIDSDYRGEVQVILANFGEAPFVIVRGMRIAQLVMAPVVQAVPEEWNDIDGLTPRDAGGFGSTGLE